MGTVNKNELSSLLGEVVRQQKLKDNLNSLQTPFELLRLEKYSHDQSIWVDRGCLALHMANFQ